MPGRAPGRPGGDVRPQARRWPRPRKRTPRRRGQVPRQPRCVQGRKTASVLPGPMPSWECCCCRSQFTARCRVPAGAASRSAPARPRECQVNLGIPPTLPVIAGCGGDGVVDEGGGDGGGGGEGVGVEDPGAGRGAVDEQRELLAELFRVGGAGFAGGVGEPRGDGFLVVACVPGCGVLGVVEFDGGSDVGAQGGGGGDVEGGEEPFAGREVGAVEHAGQNGGVEPAQVLGDKFVLAGEVLVGRALGHLGRRAELVHAGAVDALLAEQLLGRAEDALAGAPAAAAALGALLQLRHGSIVRQARQRPVYIVW